MPCGPNFLANIQMLELLNEDDRDVLANVGDESGHALRRPHQ